MTTLISITTALTRPNDNSHRDGNPGTLDPKDCRFDIASKKRSSTTDASFEDGDDPLEEVRVRLYQLVADHETPTKVSTTACAKNHNPRLIAAQSNEQPVNTKTDTARTVLRQKLPRSSFEASLFWEGSAAMPLCRHSHN